MNTRNEELQANDCKPVIATCAERNAMRNWSETTFVPGCSQGTGVALHRAEELRPDEPQEDNERE